MFGTIIIIYPLFDQSDDNLKKKCELLLNDLNGAILLLENIDFDFKKFREFVKNDRFADEKMGVYLKKLLNRFDRSEK